MNPKYIKLSISIT